MTQLNKLINNIAANGLENPVIKYVKTGERKFVVNGNNRLIAARRLGITSQLILQEVKLPVPGTNFKTEADVINAYTEMYVGR